MTKHDLYKTGDSDAPDVIKDRNGEVVLELCRRCGRAERELGPSCLEVSRNDPRVRGSSTPPLCGSFENR